MSQRDETRQIQRMMILSMITVISVVAVVTAVFFFMHRSDQQEASAATDSDKYKDTGKSIADRGGKTQADRGNPLEDLVTDVDQEGTKEENRDDSESDPEGSAGKLYLIKGNEKSPSPYGKVDHISYSNTEIYSEEMLARLEPEGLRLTRNEIFARHGRMFNDQELQDYFNLQDWYTPRYSPEAFDDSCLNQVERDNVQRIMEHEQQM